MKKNVITFLALALSCSFLLSACAQKVGQTEEINPFTQSSEYIAKITENGGLTDEEKAQKTRVSPSEVKEEIEALIDKTKNSNVQPDIVSEETTELVVEWLTLVDKVVAPENNEELKTLLKDKLSTYSEEDFSKFREKLVQVADTALNFIQGNPSIVGLIRKSGTNPNDVPAAYDTLEQWARWMFMD